MTGIFINYRTGDDAYAAALIDQRLRAEFGDDRVFRDTRALRPGTDFPPELWRRLELSTVLLALIGPRWLTLTDDAGRRRIDEPKDYVRREIRNALERRIPVIPVLLGGAALPSAEQLPNDIASLSTRQHVELRIRNTEPDLDQLVVELTRLVPAGRLPQPWRDVAQVPPVRSRPPVDARHTQVRITGNGHSFGGPVTGGDSSYGS